MVLATRPKGIARNIELDIGAVVKSFGCKVDLRDGIKPCEMKKRRLLFATKVAGGLYMCEGGRKEKGGKGQYVPSRKIAVMLDHHRHHFCRLMVRSWRAQA